MTAQGITVQCVYCKGIKTIPFEDARNLDGPPMCEKDGGPMVFISAAAWSPDTIDVEAMEKLLKIFVARIDEQQNAIRV